MVRRLTSALASSRGLFLIAVLAGALSGGAWLGIGGGDHTVAARFADADGLVAGNEVRIAGVTAGSVTSVDIATDPSTGQQYADVLFQVDNDHWPLHEGTSVAVTPKGVLSNVFVNVIPGPPGNPSLGDTPFFGLNQTQSPVGLDELNNVFTPSVTEAIRTQLQEGVLALGGAGAPDLNQTLEYADPLTKDAIPLTSVLASDAPQLSRLNFEFDTVSGDLAREDGNLRPLIVNADTLLGVLAQREIALQGTIEQGAAVFSSLNQTLSSPTTITDLQNFFNEGQMALTCADATASYLAPLISSVNPDVADLDTLLREFVTATGYNTGTKPPPSTSGVDTTRVNTWLGAGGSAGGGLAHEHASEGNPSATDSLHSVGSPLSDGCAPISGGGG
jgi:phospholipid/cholesterol/gamma-HCH transport system substrate-binding protein